MTSASNPAAAPGTVLLLHGLWMNALVMGLLARALRRAGLRATSIGYRPMREPLAGHLERLSAALRACAPGPVHLLGHSLGGLVALHALSLPEAARVQRVLLLGSPVSGCGSATRLAALPGGQALMGRAFDMLSHPFPRVPPAAAGTDIGSIAGTRALGLGRLVLGSAADGDGVVSVAETRLPGLAAHRAIAVSHSGMLFSREVARQSAAWLRDGAFLP